MKTTIVGIACAAVLLMGGTRALAGDTSGANMISQQQGTIAAEKRAKETADVCAPAKKSKEDWDLSMALGFN